MSKLEAELSYYPRAMDFSAGPITVSSLPDLDTTVADVSSSETVDDGWIYPGAQLVKQMGGGIYERPYPARIFGLPRTHRIELDPADGNDHLEFHVWALSFFVGMRLTTTEAGFVDSTPLKPGALTGFVLVGKLEDASGIAEAFWSANRGDPIRAKLWGAALHAHFIAQNRQSLQYERFIYLYTALDACFALAKALNPTVKPPVTHTARIDWMCKLFGMTTPEWADPAATPPASVAQIRNPTLHEALYMGEPLGFALHGLGTNQNLNLEMQGLVCRFLAAMIGVPDVTYIQSAIHTRQRQGLHV